MSTKNKSTEQFTYNCFHSVQANTNSALVLMCLNVNLKIKLYNWEANVFFRGVGGGRNIKTSVDCFKLFYRIFKAVHHGDLSLVVSVGNT